MSNSRFPITNSVTRTAAVCQGVRASGLRQGNLERETHAFSRSEISNSASRKPPTANLTTKAIAPNIMARTSAPCEASPHGVKMQAINETYKRSFKAEASSITARWRPEYSSTIASCTMVSSRCVAGLSTGILPFSAIATMTSPMSAKPYDTRNSKCESIWTAISESCVEPAMRATTKTIMIIAGSAREANIVSRLEPMPPKLVPTSMPASARKNLALPNRAVMTMRSADQAEH